MIATAASLVWKWVLSEEERSSLGQSSLAWEKSNYEKKKTCLSFLLFSCLASASAGEEKGKVARVAHQKDNFLSNNS